MKTYIINPDTNKPVSIEDWRKDENPTRAQLLAIETDDEHLLIMSKKYLPEAYDFAAAQKATAAFKPKGMESITFRCPTRKECIDLYDARFNGLDEAIKLTDGDFATQSHRYWTCEKDANPDYANYAWCSYGDLGYLYGNGLYYASLALPVALLK